LIFYACRSEENEEYNDIPLIYEEEHYQTLLDGGIDRLLAQHIAHLFIRDPVSLFSEKVHQDNSKDSDHFEVREYTAIASICLSSWVYLFELICRIFNRQIGKQCDSSLLHLTAQLDGEWNFVLVKFS